MLNLTSDTSEGWVGLFNDNLVLLYMDSFQKEVVINWILERN